MVAHRRSFLVLLVVLGVVGTGCPPNAGDNNSGSLSEEDIAAIKEAVKDGANVYKDRKVDAHERFSQKFTSDGEARAPSRTPKNGKKGIQEFSEASPRIDSLSVTNITVQGSGNNAQVTADFSMAGKTNDPAASNAVTKPVSSQGKLKISMKKENGKWLAKNLKYE